MQAGLAQMLKGGVIMDVTTAAEARIAEEAGRRRSESRPNVFSDSKLAGHDHCLCRVTEDC